MKKHFLLLVILTLFPFIASNAVGNRALKLQTNSLLSEDELSYCIPDANSRTSSTERRLETITISGATSKGVSFFKHFKQQSTTGSISGCDRCNHHCDKRRRINYIMDFPQSNFMDALLCIHRLRSRWYLQ